MTIRSWARKLFARRPSKTRKRSRTSPRMSKIRSPLSLEVLEDRTLLNGTPSATLQLLPPAGQSTPAAVTLNLDHFQFGFHKPVPPIGSGIAGGIASFDALDVIASYTANSPQLFAQLVTGQNYDSAVLTQKDASGNPVAVWALSTVFVTDDVTN